jgi:hypothetical protein
VAWFSLIIGTPFQPGPYLVHVSQLARLPESSQAAAWPVAGSTVKCILHQVNVRHLNQLFSGNSNLEFSRCFIWHICHSDNTGTALTGTYRRWPALDRHSTGRHRPALAGTDRHDAKVSRLPPA